MDTKQTMDGGYGISGNIAMDIFISLLPNKDKKEFCSYLHQKDPKKYEQFIKYENILNKDIK